jgi:hypothetical protein
MQNRKIVLAMGDVSFEQAPPLINPMNEATKPAKRTWLVGAWAISTVVATTGWWASLAWATFRFAQYALP